MAFMDVGVVEVRYRIGISQAEFEKLVVASVQPRACEWGATHLVRPTVGGKVAFPGAQGGVARNGSSGSVMVTLYRKPRAGEATPLAKSLHIDESSLKSQVSFDTSCPEGEITVLRKHETQGSGSYELRACGQDLKYSRQGSVFQKVN